MRRARPDRWAPRATGAVLATVLLALATLAARPAQAQDPEGAPAADVRFTGVSTVPWVTHDGSWTLALQLDGAPADGQVRAVIRGRLADRAAYHAALFGIVEGAHLATIPPIDLATAPSDEDGEKQVSLAVTLLGAGTDAPGWKFLTRGLRPGVYPIEIEVVDGAGATRAGTVVFLTRVPDGEEQGGSDPPLLVAPLVSLDAPPSVAADGRTHLPAELLDQGETLVEGLDLTTELLGAPLPLTLAPRPESIEALARDEEGADLVGDLHERSEDRQVLDAPYVDVPLSAWVEAGLGDELTRQRVRGNTVLSHHVGPIDSSTFLTPSGLTPATAAELWNVGVRTLVYGSDAVDPPAPTTTPFPVSAGEGRALVAVAPDGSLSAALTRRRDPVLDQSGLAAELALLAAEDDAPHGVALVVPPGWPARADDVVGVAGTLLAPDAPVRATTIADLVASVPLGPERPLPGVQLEDLGDQPDLLRQARARLASYTSMTGADDPTVASLDQRLLLSGSATLPPATRRRHIDTVLRTTARGFAGVEAPPRQTITLTSSEGTVPLTLRSTSEQPVRVLIELDAGTRLQFRKPRQLVTLTPGINRIPVPVHARAPGDSAMDITLRTPDGAEVLDEVRYTVRSTAVPGIGVVLSIGAAGFLLLWWARHWRATRRSRAAGPSGT